MNESKQVPMWIREIVVINAAVFVLFGVGVLLFPAQYAAWLELEVASSSAFADLRAVYGGLSLACEALFALGLRRASWFEPSLFLVMASSAGLALARVYSLVLSGMPNALVLAFLSSEVGSFVWALLAYRALAADGARVDEGFAARPTA